MQTVFELAKQQRVALSCAVLVGLFLTMYGHAPLFPVLAGCLLGVGLVVMRSWPKTTSRGRK